MYAGSAEECARLTLEAVPSVMRLIRGEIRAIARAKFTVPQFRILNQLSRRGTAGNHELAEWMGVSAPTMSRMIEVLVKRGLIVRVQSPGDRRCQNLSLTELGRDETGKIREVLRKQFSDRFSGLTGDQCKAISAGLNLLRNMTV